MIWEKIKTDIYYSDGSLRDIYVLDSTIEDWKKWIDFINENYQVKFKYFDNQGNKKIESKINFDEVSKYWNNYENSISAEFLVGEVLLKCYFFSIDEIENDFFPEEVKTIEQHNLIIEYLKSISKILNKEVILTPENYSEGFRKLITIN
jgi:hypothetical protein